MKIGILTFQCALNYGAVLQAYALQKYIQSKYPTDSVEIINYYPSHMRQTYGYKRLWNQNIVSAVARCVNLSIKRSRFKKFMSEYLTLSNICDETNIKKITAEFDKIIVGSDQVWNLELSNGDLNYYLDFAEPNKRYSYAASLGIASYSDNIKSKILNLLNGYRCISVRENVAISILKEIGVQKKIECVVDPTLLLNAAEWDLLCKSSPKSKKPYILVYTIKYSQELVSQAVRFANSHNYQVYYVGPYQRSIKKYYIHSPSVNDLLTLFKYSQNTFVGSFHGTVFSLVYHKNFIVNCDYHDGRNSRIENLLNIAGLNHHTLNNTRVLEEIISWDDVDNRLYLEKIRSKNYIDEIMEDEN